MDERSYIEQKQESWQQLSNALNDIAKAGPSALDRKQLASVGAGYRAVVSDLAFARSQGASEQLISYLNELAGRAHGTLYAAESARFRGVKSFLSRDFPRLFRSTWRYTLTAFLIFVLGCWLGIYLAGEGLGMAPWEMPKDVQPAEMSSRIMTNNIKVCILCFASGIAAGFFTVYFLASNGAFLASVAASQSGANSKALWTFVVSHGVIELTAIFIAGGAGLLIGSSMIAPGNLRRADAMRIAAGKGLQLFAGTIAMLIIAGIIEGFISPSPLPGWFKFAFSALTAVALIAYFGFVGRGSSSPIDEPS